MQNLRFGRLGAAACLLAALSGCDRTTEGSATESTGAQSGSATTTSATASTKSSAAPMTTETQAGDPSFSHPDYGVVPTTRHPLTANETTCEPPQSEPAITYDARTADPAAPVAIVVMPEGFTPSPGSGDVALTLTGPDGITGSVSITPTNPDPLASFSAYSDALTAKSPISSVSVLPGDLCDYSGQKLMGMLADAPGKATDFADRVVHVWTNTGDYLIAIHLQGPQGAAGFNAAESELLADFGVRIP